MQDIGTGFREERGGLYMGDLGCTYRISTRRKFEEGEKWMGGKTGWVDFKKCDLTTCPTAPHPASYPRPLVTRVGLCKCSEVLLQSATEIVCPKIACVGQNCASEHPGCFQFQFEKLPMPVYRVHTRRRCEARHSNCN